MSNTYDIIVVGAGAIGVPVSWQLALTGRRVLVVEELGGVGQGDCKRAIGGVRATHSDPAKILACKRSLEILKSWRETYGDDIEWITGGYLFPAYSEAVENTLKGLFPIQRRFGLNNDFISAERVQQLVPGICAEGLRGGAFSPEDGTCSPLLTINAVFFQAQKAGVIFHFHEPVVSLNRNAEGHITGLTTTRATYEAPIVIDCAGAKSKHLLETLGDPSLTPVPVNPDMHEAAITEPVQRFFDCMVVDIRAVPGSKNYYFYQNPHGQIIFCMTPDPPLYGNSREETADFLPRIAPRLINLMPRLRNIKVRRCWRGLYPMTPDASPVIGWNPQVPGLLHVTGMCGQGFMLGPGLGETVSRLICGTLTETDNIILEGFALTRKFRGPEALK